MFDLEVIIARAKEVIWKIISYPFIIWRDYIPMWFRYALFVFFGLIGIYILYLAWKERNEWRRYYRN